MNIANWLMKTIVAFQAIPLPEEPGQIAVEDYLTACQQIPDIYPLLFRGGFIISLLINDMATNTSKVRRSMEIDVEARGTVANLIKEERASGRKKSKKSDGIYGITWLTRTLAMVVRIIQFLLYGEKPFPQVSPSAYRQLQNSGLLERGEMIETYPPPQGWGKELEITDAASGAFHLAKSRATLIKEAGTTEPELKRLMAIAATTMELYVSSVKTAMRES